MEIRVEPGRLDDRQADAPISEPALARAVTEAAQVLEQTLLHVESMLERMEERAEHLSPGRQGMETRAQELLDLKRALREVVQRLEEALDHLGLEAQRLSDEASRLSLIADRLEARLNQLTLWVEQGRPAREREPALEPEPLAPEEPRFQTDDQAVRIVLAAVPGFQGLMDAQRALSALPAVEGASVVGYKNGEASLEVVLHAPVSAREIVEGLGRATGHQLLIEESRPEALRLRLRFIDQEGRG